MNDSSANFCYPVAPMESVSILLRYFALAFSALLPLINPLGSALEILAVVGDAPPHVYHVLARKIAINTVLFLLVFELVGAALLAFSAFPCRRYKSPADSSSPDSVGSY